MARLVTFGCSHTWGAGLPDTYPKSKGDPSQLAWPNLLSKKLNYELVNNGSSGAGNAEILYKILNFEFLDNDLCVIMWAHFVRYKDFHLSKNYEPQRKHSRPGLFSHEIFEFFNYTLPYHNYMAFHHASLYLRSKKIKNFMFIAEQVDFQEYQKPNFLEIPELNFITHAYRVDLGLDNLHFGVKSHETLSDMIYNRLQA